MTRSLIAAGILAIALPSTSFAQDLGPWPQHSMDRPVPPVVTPAPTATPGAPPSDAVVLFDGQSLTGWETDSAKPAGWKVASILPIPAPAQ